MVALIKGPRGREFRRVLAGLLVTLLAGSYLLAQESDFGAPEEDESLIRWQHYLPISLPDPGDNDDRLLEVIVPPAVFGKARVDLADLRLATPDGQVLPYALRVLRAENIYEKFEAQEFNRSHDPADGTHTVTLDLMRDDIEHNQLEIDTTGNNVRRVVNIEGSNDGNSWQRLGGGHLVKYLRDRTGDGATPSDGLNLNRIDYPPSRYRYLRVQIQSDPVGDKEPWELTRILVVRRSDIPGEMLKTTATLGVREATRAFGQPASGWLVELGGDQVPCERLEVEVEEPEFARDYFLEAGGLPSSSDPFYQIISGTWQRRAGEENRPMAASFGEVRASRLRLVISDYQNPPLSLQTIYALAPVRQVVFSHPPTAIRELRLYFGNSRALLPNYDFARNLPRRLDARPTRLELGVLQANPNYIPAPKPLTERWPALTYVVLSLVSMMLGALIISVARAAMKENPAMRGKEADEPENG